MSIGGHLSEASAILAQTAMRPLPILAAMITVVALAFAGRGILGRSDPAQAFGAGMGLLVLVGTILGVLGLDLRLAIALVAVLAALVAVRDRREMKDWLSLAWPMALVAMPLLLVLSDRRGSEWDEFSHWLHAFRYLEAHHVLPGNPGGPAMESCCAAYPYGWPLVGLAAMTLSGFSEAMPGLLNVLVLALFAMLMLRLATGDGEERGTLPSSLPAAATALLFATVASPTFVNKLAFSAYADVATAFLAAVLAMTAERLAAEGDGRQRLRLAVTFGLTGAALLAVKPGNAALFGCLLGGGLVLGVRRHGLRFATHVEMIAAVALPAICSLIWRVHVGQHLTGQEMVILPREQWHVDLIPRIVMAMLDVASNKGGHFGLGVLMVGLGVRGLWRNGGQFDRLCALAGMLFLGYNLFLLLTYVVVFGDYEALHVASYWRYNTHLGLVIMLPAAMAAGRLVRILPGNARQALGVTVVALVLVGPALAVKHIRFDFDRSKPFLRESLRSAGSVIPPGSRVTVIDAEGTGLSGVMATYEWSGQLKLAGYLSVFNSTPPRDMLDRMGVDWAFVFSGHERMGLGPTWAAQVVHRDGSQWRVVKSMPFPGGSIPDRWP